VNRTQRKQTHPKIFYREQRLWHLDCDRRELCSRRSLLSSAVPCARNQVSLLLLAKKLKKYTEQQQRQV